MQNNVKGDAEKGCACVFIRNVGSHFQCGSYERSMLYCRYTLRIKWFEGEIGFEKEKRYQSTFAYAGVCFDDVRMHGRGEGEEKRMSL